MVNVRSMTVLTIDCQPLTIDDVVEVARGGRRVALGAVALEAMTRSRAVIDRLLAESAVVYGVTTGFGKFADRVIPPQSLERLQHNLIVSHSVGVGEPLPADVVRGMMVLRVASLARGHSGIRPVTVQAMVDMLNADIVPYVPSRGSVGASGDLAPLAHLALVLIGLGEATFEGARMAGSEALRRAGLEPMRLAAKEGLALINGTQLMTACGCLLLADARNLLAVADIAGAMSLEAVRGTDRAFNAQVHAVRPHPGQIDAGAWLRELTADSEIMASHRHDSHKVQDPYSLRCMPQVHGASRDAVRYVESVLSIEVNSVTDNPLIFPETDEIISCGNFHGQPLALALDFLGIALAELASISERRIEAMLDPVFSELPPFLTVHGGVESGFMVSQYTAAALVSENKVLAHPASVDSIPTSANQEDHVSMGATAALKAQQIARNVETVLGIELLCGCEGLDYRRPLRTGERLEAVHALIRTVVPHLDEDRVMYPDIEASTSLVRSGAVVRAARSVHAV
jgi:histidine ammonia-lyase